MATATRRKTFTCFALLPPFFLDCVVALGLMAGDGTKKWMASGFLYGEFIEKRADGNSDYYTYLVTNRHVLNDQSKIFVRFNPQGDEAAKEYELALRDEAGKPKWFSPPDPNIDVAVLSVNAGFLREQQIKFQFFISDQLMADRRKAGELGVSEGDGVYVLGFPLDLVGGLRNFVIVRQGVIARIRDFLAESSKEFLIDSFTFPGNSGGPVVTRGEIVAVQGTKAESRSYLIGVVKSYVAYRETAVSLQTQRPRITFEENSGLASVVPMDYVREAIKEHQKSLPPSARRSPF
jgi:S1-C subfamily serine protease